jgi:hypothetical protein
MANQLNLFDIQEGLRRKEEGIRRVTLANSEWLAVARSSAARYAEQYGSVTADDVRGMLYPQGYIPHHPNAWGAVFKEKRWVPTGERVQSRVPSRHGNEIRVWRLKW